MKSADMLHQLLPPKYGYVYQDLYPYKPSETAAYAFVAIFAIAGFTHLCLDLAVSSVASIFMMIDSASKSALKLSYLVRLNLFDSGSRLLPSPPPIA